MRLAACLLLSCITVPALAHSHSVAEPRLSPPHDEAAAWWFESGAKTALKQRQEHRGDARNLILFIGDGMSIPTLAAARILGGQRQGHSGEEYRLSFEDFPHTALSRTYNTDFQTPDSAGTATALTSGVKTRLGMIGLGQSALFSDCASAKGQEVLTLLELAEIAGLATGVVTTTRLTHATPAATYSHSADRNWESDASIPEAKRAEGCRDIARQLIEFPFGDGIDVALGGGRRHFTPTQQPDLRDPPLTGARLDGRDLTQEWANKEGAIYVTDRDQLAAIDSKRGERVLGLFASDHLQFDHERRQDARGEPSLAEMTRFAITHLKDRKEGYVLLIEGGRIDHAHHGGNAYRALDDTLALSDAVRVANELTSSNDTLIMVTSDHAHVMSMAGYPARGNPILGLVKNHGGTENGESVVSKDALGLPYTTLSYANGLGYAGPTDKQASGDKRVGNRMEGVKAATHADLSQVDTTHPDFLQPALYPLGGETHGGDDVAVFARGPGDKAVRGSLEQNVLFHLLVQAQPTLRKTLCAIDACNTDNEPVILPNYGKLLESHGTHTRDSR